MFGFFIKKWFFGMWDNLFHIVLLNLGFIVLLLGSSYLFFIAFGHTALFLGVTLVIAFLFSLFSAAVSGQTKAFADFESVGFKDLLSKFKPALKPALVMAGFITFQVILATIIIPFYLSMEGYVGLVLGALLFWFCLFFWLMMQYFYPMYWKMEKNVRKAIKKCLLLLLDNTFFTIGLAISSLVVLVLSFFTAFMLPGFSSIFQMQQEALKLRMYKYDYLEENPDANRKRIPWDGLLAEDRDKLGPRTFRNMIFPWK